MKHRKLSPTMKVADVLKRWPQTFPVFLKYHMGCVGCVMGPYETLLEVSAIYHLSLADFLEDLQTAIHSEIIQNNLTFKQII